ncbi:MAG TPA: hypothetical protein VLA68_02710, partial [Nitrososphaera sp.]|nr:hypothetical protein [Nitrososphaera sp.]
MSKTINEPSIQKDVPIVTYKIVWGRPAIPCLSERETAGALTDMIRREDQRFYLPHSSLSN